jgi:uncharacterized protein (DUF433 family)
MLISKSNTTIHGNKTFEPIKAHKTRSISTTTHTNVVASICHSEVNALNQPFKGNTKMFHTLFITLRFRIIYDDGVHMAETWKNRISIDSEILAGKPIVKGTRLSVEFIMELIANGWTHPKILKNYPQLNQQDIVAVLKYATKVMKEEKIYLIL